jgi:hypothetical protein
MRRDSTLKVNGTDLLRMRRKRSKGKNGRGSTPDRFLSRRPTGGGMGVGGGMYNVNLVQSKSPGRCCWYCKSPRQRRALTRKVHSAEYCHLCCLDPFHSLLGLRFRVIIFLYCASYVCGWTLFAPVYMSISDQCGLNTTNFQDAMYYSVITMSTIGYGTADMTFNGCSGALVVIMCQTLLGMLMNAVLMGLVYSKVSRSKNRTVFVQFSNKSCVRCVNGNFYFMFQVFDRASTSSNDQLIEAHVRCYAIRHDRGDKGEPVFFQQATMRLSHPNDEGGGMLFMVLPNMVTHRIDPWSPLCPRPPAPDSLALGLPHDPMNDFHFPDILLRADDADGGGRSSYWCEICGESYETRAQLKTHQQASAIDDRMSGHSWATLCKTTGESLPSNRALKMYNKFLKEERARDASESESESESESGDGEDGEDGDGDGDGDGGGGGSGSDVEGEGKVEGKGKGKDAGNAISVSSAGTQVGGAEQGSPPEGRALGQTGRPKNKGKGKGKTKTTRRARGEGKTEWGGAAGASYRVKGYRTTRGRALGPDGRRLPKADHGGPRYEDPDDVRERYAADKHGQYMHSRINHLKYLPKGLDDVSEDSAEGEDSDDSSEDRGNIDHGAGSSEDAGEDENAPLLGAKNAGAGTGTGEGEGESKGGGGKHVAKEKVHSPKGGSLEHKRDGAGKTCLKTAGVRLEMSNVREDSKESPDGKTRPGWSGFRGDPATPPGKQQSGSTPSPEASPGSSSDGRPLRRNSELRASPSGRVRRSSTKARREKDWGVGGGNSRASFLDFNKAYKEDTATNAQQRCHDRDAIRSYLKDSHLEVIVLVEAIETYTSNTMQARHSYSAQRGEIVMDHMHAPCVQTADDGSCEIDLDMFHTILPAPKDIPSMQSTPSYS